MSIPASSSTALYRLRGRDDGNAVSFVLESGETRIGSSRSNDLVLAQRGVSRRHAVLDARGEGAFVEDLESRNGTSINGERVPAEGSKVEVGDELAFGPVLLRLERVHPEDAELGMSLAGEGGEGLCRPGSWATRSRETTAAGPGAPWLGLLAAIVRHLTLSPAPDLDGASRTLMRGLGATGAALVHWPPGSGAVVSRAVGEIGSVPPKSALRDAARGLFDPGLRVLRGGGEAPLLGVVAEPRGREPRGLLVWGAASREGESEGLLSACLRLFHRFQPWAQEPESPPAVVGEAPGPRRLVFPEGIVPGEAPAMISLYQQMQPLVASDLPVVIEGETGVGKEHLARVLHESSPRAGKPFIAVNCAAIPAELLEAEMFGIGPGVATGVRARRGLFQEAQEGTIFLDEIGEMPLELQAKLLRALQEKEIHPLGRPPLAVDVRVVAATNTDLRARLEDGRFREDLYYRIAGYSLEVPPLRRRREDVPRLLGHFLQAFGEESAKALRGVTVRALRALTAYGWPGNVRELEHVARRLVFLCPRGQAIDSEMLPQHVLQAPPEEPAPAPDAGLDESLEALERKLLRQALTRTAGNQSRAARHLKISRNGLAKRLKRLGIAASEFEG